MAKAFSIEFDVNHHKILAALGQPFFLVIPKKQTMLSNNFGVRFRT